MLFFFRYVLIRHRALLLILMLPFSPLAGCYLLIKMPYAGLPAAGVTLRHADVFSRYA